MRNVMTIFAGAAVGAVAALFLAPTSGKKMRKKLNKQARKMQMEMKAQSEKGFDKFSSIKENGVDKLNELKHNTEQIVEDAAKNMNGNIKTEFVD